MPKFLLLTIFFFGLNMITPANAGIERVSSYIFGENQAVTTPQTPPTKDPVIITKTESSDTSITESVQSKLIENNDLSKLNLTILTKDGVVSIFGTANTREQADAAIKTAQSVNGVKSVKSQITVNPNMDNPSTQ